MPPLVSLVSSLLQLLIELVQRRCLKFTLFPRLLLSLLLSLVFSRCLLASIVKIHIVHWYVSVICLLHYWLKLELRYLRQCLRLHSCHLRQIILRVLLFVVYENLRTCTRLMLKYKRMKLVYHLRLQLRHFFYFCLLELLVVVHYLLKIRGLLRFQSIPERRVLMIKGLISHLQAVPKRLLLIDLLVVHIDPSTNWLHQQFVILLVF